MNLDNPTEQAALMEGPSQRTERFIRDITDELKSGSISFPTYVEATLRVRRMIEDPDVSADTLARIVVTEPLLSAKLIRLANSAALHSGGQAVSDVKTAVLRVGMARMRTLAIAVAIDQLCQARQMSPLRNLARQLWEHSTNVAAIAYVIARKLTQLNPDTALFAGIVHDIGQFYLLSRVIEYPELLDASSEISSLMFDLHKVVGHSVLQSLSTPDEVVKAIDDQEVYGSGFPPTTLGDVLFIANQITTAPNPFWTTDAYSREVMRQAATFSWERETVESVVAESELELNSIMSALSA